MAASNHAAERFDPRYGTRQKAPIGDTYFLSENAEKGVGFPGVNPHSDSRLGYNVMKRDDEAALKGGSA